MAQEQQGQAEGQPAAGSLDQARAVALKMLQDEEKPQAASTEEAAPAPTPEAAKENAKPEDAEAKTEESPQLRFKVKYKAEDGSDVEAEVEQDELVKGYMLEKSYRQKTAQLAREREAIQEKIRSSVEPKAKEYEDKLALVEQVIVQTLAPEIQSIDWNKLAAENPAEWAQKFQMAQSVNARLGQIQAERARLASEREKESKAQMQKQVQTAVEKLREEIPGWGDELYGKILKTGIEEYGFKAEEVKAMIDPRAIKVLHDAMQFRALKAKPAVEKRVATTPKVVKPGGAEKPDPSAEKWTDGMARLQKTHRWHDAVPLARQILEREGYK